MISPAKPQNLEYIGETLNEVRTRGQLLFLGLAALSRYAKRGTNQRGRWRASRTDDERKGARNVAALLDTLEHQAASLRKACWSQGWLNAAIQWDQIRDEMRRLARDWVDDRRIGDALRTLERAWQLTHTLNTNTYLEAK